MPLPSTVQFLCFAATFLALIVLLRRVRHLEGKLRRAARRADAGPVPPPPALDAPPTPLTGFFDELLRSPLTVILAQCELARGRKEMSERLELIERQARRIHDLLARQRAQQAPGPATPAPAEALDPARCLRAAVDSLAEFARARGVSVHADYEDTPAVRANPFLLDNALRHLVRAAIEAAPQGVGDVTAAVGELGGDIAFAVADDGPGLAPERLAIIFDPASVGPEGPRAEELGYAIVHAVSRAMSSRFVLESAPDIGTRATLRMTAVPATVVRPPPAVPGTARETTPAHTA